MKKAIKRIVSLFLVLTIIFGSAAVGLGEVDFGGIKFENPFVIKTKAVSGGTCGDNLTWTLDDSGTLTISGTGAMDDYSSSYSSLSPWFTLSSNIKFVVIEKGVTNIGDFAFYYCSSLTSVTIPNSVTSIGNGAFVQCSSLTSITIPDSVTSIGFSAFSKCTSLTSAAIPDSVISIGEQAFLNSAYYNDNSNWENDVLYIGNHLIKAKTTISGEYAIKEGTKTISDAAFSHCKSLTSIIIADGITSISDFAFRHCTALTSITIPVSVSSIGSQAFDYCLKLNAVYITDIAKWCSITFSYSTSNPFYYANKLYLNGELVTDLVIPDSITSINDYAFYYCSSLVSIEIPDSVTSIGCDAFYKCTKLTSITIPDSVTSIGNYAFYYCSSLVSIEIPDSVTSIGCDAFYNTAYYNDSSNWENNVLYMGNHLIKAKTNISGKYSIKEGTKTIAYGAFLDRNNITAITIPESVISIGDKAFYGCDYLTDVLYNGSQFDWENITIGLHNSNLTDATIRFVDGILVFEINNDGLSYTVTDCDTSASGKLDIPSMYKGKPVTSIGKFAFYQCNNLYSINIPDSVTNIGDSAFSYCTSLTSVTIPDSVTSIDRSAFSYCTRLTSVTIPDSVTRIDYDAFYSCNNLSTVQIFDVASWCNVDFMGCYSNPLFYAEKLYLNEELITDLVVPEGVTSIGDYTFKNCKNLISVTIPASVTCIGAEAFDGCTKIKAVHISDVSAWCNILFSTPAGEGFIYVKSNPVYYSGNLYLNGELVTDLVIPEDTTRISSFAFARCSSLASVLIPESVKSIGENAFYDCTGLTSIVISDSVTSIDAGAFYDTGYYNNDSNWEDSVLYIGHHLIDSKKSISPDYTIKQGTKTIASAAFGGNLETIVIPDSIISICDYAFEACYKLKSVFYEGTESDWSSIAIGYSGLGVSKIHYNAVGHTPSDWIIDNSTHIKYKECTVCKEVLQRENIPLNVTTITSCYNEVKGVQLKWNAVTGAVKYEIYRKTSSQSSWEKITSTSEIAYQDTSVTGNTVYQYKIKAVDQYGNASNYSAQRECRFIATPQLKSISNSVGGLTITWEKVAGATSYRIYRRGAGTNYWYYLGDVSASQNKFFDKESSLVSSGNYYRYTVRASYSGKDSAGKDYLIYSGFDTNGLYLKYVATPKLTSISNATGGLQIKWNAVNGNGRVEYRVYRRGAGSTYWTYLGTTTSTTWTDAGVKNASGNYYRYTVRAVQGTNGSGWYSAFDTTGLYLKRLANPTLKSAASAKAGITVKWNVVAGTTGYYVYRKTANSGWTRIASVSGTNNTTHLDKTAKKGTTYVYTVRAVYGSTTSYFNSGISCKDLY